MSEETPSDRPLRANFNGDNAAEAARAAQEAVSAAAPEGAQIDTELDELELRAVARAERMDALLGAVEAAVDAVVAAAGDHGAGVDVRTEGEGKPAKGDSEDA